MALDIDTSSPDHVKIRFVLPANEPECTVSVVGSFNHWTPGLDELTPNIAGTRSVVVASPYGQRHVFRYLGTDDQWFDEPDADEITAAGSVLRPVSRPM